MNVYTLLVAGNYIYAGTDNGVYRRALADIDTSASVISLTADTIVFSFENNKISDTITIRNNGKTTLVIDSITSTDSAITISDPTTLAPGDSINVVVSVKTESPRSRTAYMLIVTNDPLHPVDSVEIIIQGTSAVTEPGTVANAPLLQNYPNPFDAATTIRYTGARKRLCFIEDLRCVGHGGRDASKRRTGGGRTPGGVQYRRLAQRNVFLQAYGGEHHAHGNDDGDSVKRRIAIGMHDDVRGDFTCTSLHAFGSSRQAY